VLAEARQGITLALQSRGQNGPKAIDGSLGSVAKSVCNLLIIACETAIVADLLERLPYCFEVARTRSRVPVQALTDDLRESRRKLWTTRFWIWRGSGQVPLSNRRTAVSRHPVELKRKRACRELKEHHAKRIDI
jgi:hypothetical protein